jgi:hypothetical protein
VKRGTPASSTSIPRFTLNVLAKGSNDSLISRGLDTGQAMPCDHRHRGVVTIARPVRCRTAREKTELAYVLQVACGETIDILSTINKSF